MDDFRKDNDMTKADAIDDYKKLTYKLAKAVAKLTYIRERMHYINETMGWDGMFEINFDTALRELAEVESASIIYTFEDEFHDDDIDEMQSNLDALKG